MKKYSTLTLLILLSASFFILSCHKDDAVNGVRLIPAEMKAYWNFKVGTYWIYKDSATSDIDSVYVTSDTDYTGKGILNYTQSPITYEYLQVNTHSSLDGYDYDYYINTEDGFKGITNGNKVWESKSNSSNYIDTHPCFVYPLNLGFYTELSYGGRQDSCLVKNIFSYYYNYSNVVELTSSFNEFEYENPSTSFYVINIGLIRYQVPRLNKVRTLIRTI